MQQQKGDFSQGSIPKTIIRLAVPLMIAQIINVLYSIVDRIYIGHMEGVGQLALTGVGVAFPVITIITAFTNLCGMGGAPLFSMARGKGSDERASQILGNACSLLLILAVILMALGFTFKRPILYLFGASDDTISYADEYLTIYLMGTPFSMLATGLNPFINAQGFAMRGMLTVLLGAIINIILDPILIFLVGMGVEGAALATIFSQFISAVWVLHFLTGKKATIRLELRRMRLSANVVKPLISLGISPFVMSMTNSIVQAMYNSSLQRYGGDVYVAAMTVITSIREVILMALHGVTNGAQPVIGYNYGAKLYRRTREGIRFMGVFCVLYTLVVWLVLLLFPGPVIHLFNNDPGLLQVGEMGVRIFFSMQILMALQTIGQNTFLALGMSRQATFFSLFRKVILVVPLILILPHLFGLGATGVFLAEPISDVIGGIACFTTMMLLVWRKLKRLEAQQAGEEQV